MLKGSAPRLIAEFMRTSFGPAKDVCTEFERDYRRSLVSYVSMLEKAGAGCIGLPYTMPDVYTVYTEVGHDMVKLLKEAFERNLNESRLNCSMFD